METTVLLEVVGCEDDLGWLDFLLAGEITVGETGFFRLDFLLAGARVGNTGMGGDAEAGGEGESGGDAEAGGETEGKGDNTRVALGEVGPSGVLMIVQSDAGGEGSALVCGGDFMRQLPRAFGLPLFLFSPSGTALT